MAPCWGLDPLPIVPAWAGGAGREACAVLPPPDPASLPNGSRGSEMEKFRPTLLQSSGPRLAFRVN